MLHTSITLFETEVKCLWYYIGMLNQIETILSNYTNIINLFIAIGTVGAVITSLYYSNLTLRPKIEAIIYSSELLYPVGNDTYKTQNNEKYISLNIVNKGFIPIYIPYLCGFSWFFIFCKTAWMQIPINPIFKDKDFELLQYKSASFVLCKYSDFIENLKESLIKKEKYPKFLLRFLKLKIRTSNNEIIVAKFDKKLLQRILNDIR